VTTPVLVVAAEASSTLYAQRLLELWKKEHRAVSAFGIGSREMENLGFEILGRSEDLAVVGLQEVLAHFSQIRETFNRILAEAKARKPAFALLLDYPGFNLRLAKRLKALGIPVVYYISPQVWAWRTSRVYDIKKTVDRMLVVFPFEVDFYRKYDIPVNFVGHPLLDEISEDLYDAKTTSEQRSKFGFTDQDLVLALMPGSRKSELRFNLQVQIQAAEKLSKKYPRLQVALFVAPNFSLDEIQRRLPEIQFPLRLIQAEPFTMIRLADVVLCASGTATLMVGLLGKPMVIMYKMNAITAFLAKLIVKNTPFFGLINLVLGRRVVPELFQEQANLDGLCTALEVFINDPQNREKTHLELLEARHCLGNRGATERVNEALQPFFEATTV
jgi:lipid-A-disaccharide synthase